MPHSVASDLGLHCVSSGLSTYILMVYMVILSCKCFLWICLCIFFPLLLLILREVKCCNNCLWVSCRFKQIPLQKVQIQMRQLLMRLLNGIYTVCVPACVCAYVCYFIVVKIYGHWWLLILGQLNCFLLAIFPNSPLPFCTVVTNMYTTTSL